MGVFKSFIVELGKFSKICAKYLAFDEETT